MLRQINIPNPELLLPDEHLSPAQVYIAESSFIGGNYPSLLALIRKREKVEAQLNSQMADWQRAIAGPCFVMYAVVNDVTKERMPIYGKIDTPTGFVDSGDARVKDMTEASKMRLVRRLESAHRRGWLYGLWTSRTQSLGEYGVMHRALIQQVLPEAEYREVEARAWKG